MKQGRSVAAGPGFEPGLSDSESHNGLRRRTPRIVVDRYEGETPAPRGGAGVVDCHE